MMSYSVMLKIFRLYVHLFHSLKFYQLYLCFLTYEVFFVIARSSSYDVLQSDVENTSFICAFISLIRFLSIISMYVF